ncbi:4-(cytidine 5'-diphospho)-2-C-methyl-D-erythritol kinase, partial [Francisella tularensis subsp. holarctica]|nr:4-(cytidine 5'-diphospho)-2-C-methyl-D-erythritol kinase [Francisella tularensis subsp. holarctica]
MKANIKAKKYYRYEKINIFLNKINKLTDGYHN